jgi:hypothetical protein
LAKGDVRLDVSQEATPRRTIQNQPDSLSILRHRTFVWWDAGPEVIEAVLDERPAATDEEFVRLVLCPFFEDVSSKPLLEGQGRIFKGVWGV